jgi:hypothetical protein
LFSVGRLTNHLEVFFVGEQTRQAISEEGVIVS